MEATDQTLSAIGGGLDANRHATGEALAINNLSAEMEATDQLRISTRVLTNTRRNVAIEEVEVLNQSTFMNMPSWWVNGQNAYGNAIEGTSNYTPHLFYLLDPASILSDTQLVTPDGNSIRRVEVALDPSDSVFHAAIGAYAAWYGVRERVTVGAPTTVVLFAQARQDGVTNPDQVSGTPDVFAAYTHTVSQWQRNTLSYTLKAEGDVLLESSQDDSTLHSTSTSSGASVGVGISFGASTGITLNASANKGKGNADGLDVLQRNTNIVAGNTARIESGADTTLAGATVSGRTVQAEVGGNLNIESRQDTGKFKSDQSSSGWGVSLCIPPICYGASSVSVSGGEQNIESEFASVIEQSAIRAGDGGFQVNVQGDTTLTGGAITSTDKAVQNEKNRFATGGELKLSDVENHAEFKGDGYSVNVAVAVAGAEAKTPEQQKLAPAAPAKNEGSAGIGEDSGKASSTTQAAISGIAGNTGARTGDTEAGIAPIFDRQRVQQEIDAQIKITAEFGKQASLAIGDYATKKYNELKATDPEEAAKWDEGGVYRSLAHAVVGGLTGGAAGAAGAGLASLSADTINQLTEDMPDGVKNLVGVAVAAGIGALAGGATGAATAFNADMNNRQLHPSERTMAKRLAAKSGGKYTAEEIENALRNAGNTKTGESVVAGMVVDPAKRDAIYDTGAVWTTGENGWLVQVLPPQPNPELTTFIQQNTGETYNWYTPSTGGLPSDPNMARDRLTGQLLDEKGRYSQTVVLDGKAFEPKYFQCATTDCIRTGANLDMGDPASQAYIRALDSQIFKDIGTGATAGSLVTPVGAAGATLTIMGFFAAMGESSVKGELLDGTRDEVIKTLSETNATAFFRDVLGHSPMASARAVALIDLTGGWDKFVSRVKVDLLGMKANEDKK